MIAVELQNACHPASDIPSNKHFQKWVQAALHNKVTSAEVCIRIVDATESAALNLQYRNKKGATNVLAFPCDLPKDIVLDPLPLGDIVICAPLVIEEATQQHKETIAHWAHLTIHGSLHLLGFDHITETDAVIMENIEITVMQQLGFNNPYGAIADNE